MLVSTNSTIAYKCSACGTYDFFEISLFKLMNKRELCLTCLCNKCSAVISKENSLQYKIKIPCIGCGDEHIFILSRRQLFNKSMKIFRCPQTGVQLCFVGNDPEVREKIDSLEKELDELIDTFGYENYFKNTRVMFDSLNKIHDIAEHGHLYCECGSSDVELIMLPDKIQLNCRKCPGNKTVYAVSNEDLKHITAMRDIVLNCGSDDYGQLGKETLARKSDGK